MYDHSEERIWRHLDSCQFQTFLHARPQRVQCPKDGVHQVRLPWAEPKARFTLLFERLAIEVMQVTHIQVARQILRISWDEAWHLLSRVVQRGCSARNLGFSNILVSMRSRLPTDSDTSPWSAISTGAPSNTSVTAGTSAASSPILSA
uniref:transposase family protein n=1 Tax=Geomesophilobacter sediminis TaxID=2798584 RepID=UPI002E2C1999|nr:transposase family protein [Geomesophilobacter sediminis]